jgi:MFS family permease
LAISGTALLTIGTFLMSRADADISRSMLMVFVALMGIGMGFSIPPFMIAVQTTVERRQLGTATSTMQFSRSIGGTLGVSIMGAALSARLASNLSASGLDPELISQLLDPLPGAQTVINEGARIAVADAITLVFLFAFFAAGLAFVATLFTPRTELKERTTENEPLPISDD